MGRKTVPPKKEPIPGGVLYERETSKRTEMLCTSYWGRGSCGSNQGNLSGVVSIQAAGTLPEGKRAEISGVEL